MRSDFQQAWLTRSAILAGLLALAPAVDTFAQRQPAKTQQKYDLIRLYDKKTESAEGQYWIGIQVAAVSDALKSQLNIKSGLLVLDVDDESPAAKAGIQQHDILLTCDGKDLTGFDVLVDAVASSKDRDMTIELLRAGETQLVKVTPAKRPEEEARVDLPADADKEVRRWLRLFDEGDGKGPLRLHFVRPGFSWPERWSKQEGLKLPKDTRISITKKGDEPAQITVEKNGKTWVATEGELGELPEDVRPLVERMLGHGWHAEIDLRGFNPQDWFKQFMGNKETADRIRAQIETWMKEMPSGAPIAGRDQAIEELRRELKALRNEVDELRGKRGKAEEAEVEIELGPKKGK